MKRRGFVTLLGGAAVWPLVARAQSPLPVIGFLNGSSPDFYAPMVARFRQGLKETGYVEGQNITIEFRWAEGHYDRLPEMAADLVHQQVSVIVANTPANRIAKTATSTIPIVFSTSRDPVQFGLVASLNRPGGNVTGVTTLAEELGPKKLELLHELVPKASIVGLLVNPANAATEPATRGIQAAAAKLGLQLDVLRASTEAELDGVFNALLQKRAGALVIGPDTFFNSRAERLATLALGHRVPVISEFREFPVAGGLISYGGNITDSYRLAGLYTGRILKGEKPAELPVQQSTKVELVINLRTAKALGITVPPTLLASADEVIE